MSNSHVHTSARRPLAIALGLILGLMVGEVVFGIVAGSLALLADAGHMLTDAAALALALGAVSFAGRPPRGRWTFGFRRLEILAAHVNGITLLVVGVLIVYTAVRRLVDPPRFAAVWCSSSPWPGSWSTLLQPRCCTVRAARA
jgi:cobalt-zinc-cadmium efflux system protein